jgi:hypothetical protein
MDVRVTPAVTSVGSEVVLELTVTNEGTETARWSSGCGSDLSFAMLDVVGRDMLSFGSLVCSMELRNLRLEPGAVMTRKIQWRLPNTVPTGSYRVVGRLGFLGPMASRGTSAVLEVNP